MIRSGPHLGIRTVRRGVIVGAALLALSGCSEVQWPGESTGPAAAPAAVPAVAAAPAAVPTVSATAPTQLFALEFVAQTAAPCTQVWLPGADLPGDYEWCSDEVGEPVAGVRAGSCEVVVHDHNMWAVPGHQIHVTATDVTADPGYIEALTSCKRRPVAANRR